MVWRCQAGVSGAGCDAVVSEQLLGCSLVSLGKAGGAVCAEPARVWQGAWAGRQQPAGAPLLPLGSGSSTSSCHAAEHSAASPSCCRTGPTGNMGRGLEAAPVEQGLVLAWHSHSHTQPCAFSRLNWARASA